MGPLESLPHIVSDLNQISSCVRDTCCFLFYDGVSAPVYAGFDGFCESSYFRVNGVWVTARGGRHSDGLELVFKLIPVEIDSCLAWLEVQLIYLYSYQDGEVVRMQLLNNFLFVVIRKVVE